MLFVNFLVLASNAVSQPIVINEVTEGFFLVFFYMKAFGHFRAVTRSNCCLAIHEAIVVVGFS